MVDEPFDALLPTGSLLWDHVTPAHTGPREQDENGDDLSVVDDGMRWKKVSARSSLDGLIVRACPLSTVRQRLVTLREASAHEHAQMLAEIPLFAPLTTAELLALCRRATVVEVPPKHTLLPPNHAPRPSHDDDGTFRNRLEAEQLAELREVVTTSTFGLVLAGGLQIQLDTTKAGLGPENKLPALLPLAHLGPRQTFGELADAGSRMAFLNGGGRVRSADDGARLLCWPRDSIMDEELSKLSLLEGGTSLLEQSWMARTPLALLLSDPSLLKLLKPNKLSTASAEEEAKVAAGNGDDVSKESRTLMLVTSGEIDRRAAEEAELAVQTNMEGMSGRNSPSPSPTTGRLQKSSPSWSSASIVQEKKNSRRGSVTFKASMATGRKSIGDDGPVDTLDMVVEARTPVRCHSLEAVSNRLESDLGMTLRRATSDATSENIVEDSFHVSTPIPDGTSASDISAELQSKLQLLGATRMRPGDTVLTLASDGTSRLTRCEPAAKASWGSVRHKLLGLAGVVKTATTQSPIAEPTVALLDVGVLGATLALQEGEVPTMWRNYLYCHAPSLLPKSLEAVTDAAEALKRAANERAAAILSDPNTPHLDAASIGQAWLDTICSFLLYRIRMEAGEDELGMVFAELEIGLKLGEGGFGVVRLARHRVSGALYAVKSIEKVRIRRVGEERTFELLERERKTLMQLGVKKLTGLTRLVASAHDRDWLRIVMPAFLGGDLSHVLDNDGDGKGMPEEAAQFYAGCLVLALSKLHDMGVAYRDLKPENVLLSADGWPVLSDFGLVAFLGEEGRPVNAAAVEAREGEGGSSSARTYSMVGTPEFMAPEVVAGSGHDTDADWWGLGVTVCELLTLNTPFRIVDADPNSGAGINDMYSAIMQVRGLSPPLPFPTHPPYSHPLPPSRTHKQCKFSSTFRKRALQRFKPRTANLVDDLLKVDVAVRLGAKRRGVETLRVHPFFWGLSWEALENQGLEPPHKAWCEGKAKGKLDPTVCIFSPPPPPKKAGTKKVLDVATAALDRMFDFSGWGEEM